MVVLPLQLAELLLLALRPTAAEPTAALVLARPRYWLNVAQSEFQALAEADMLARPLAIA